MMIKPKDIEKIEKTIGYRFHDKSLLIQAFTRTSFVNEASQARLGRYQSNEVLEFLGDSVLSTAIITKLLSEKAKRYAHGLYTELNEGDFSNIKSHLSDKRNLSRSMDALGLAEYLVMGEGDRTSGIYEQPSVKEDLFESIIGAIFLDSNGDLKVIGSSVAKMLDVSAYIKGTATSHSAKGALQEWCQNKKRRLPMPRYETESESGPAHQKVFVRACYIGDVLYGKGSGKNCSEADAAAAASAIELLKEEEQAGRGAGSGVDRDAQTKLRNHASKNKLPYPEFRDLGESPKSTDAMKVYAVECRFLSKVSVSEGLSKSDARMKSAAQMLEMITSVEKEKKPKAQRPQGDIKKAPVGADKSVKTKGDKKNVRTDKFKNQRRKAN